MYEYVTQYFINVYYKYYEYILMSYEYKCNEHINFLNVEESKFSYISILFMTHSSEIVYRKTTNCE